MSNNQGSTAEKTWSKRHLDNLTKLSAFKFYLLSLLILVGFAALSFLLSGLGIQFKVFSTLQNLPIELKSLLSIEKWWLNKLLELIIPMLILFALKFQLLKIRRYKREAIVKLLPWLPYLNEIFISSLPLFFMATSGVILGTSIFFAYNIGVQYSWLILFPFAIAIVSLMIRKALAMDVSSGCWKKFAIKRKNCITVALLLIAFSLWIWTSILNPLKEKVEVYEYGKGLILNGKVVK